MRIVVAQVTNIVAASVLAKTWAGDGSILWRDDRCQIPYWEGMLSGAAWLSHGKTIMCGIVGGYFGVELAKWVMDIRVKTGDTFAVPVAIAVAIGRVACYQAGCCYGVATSLPWGVVFPTAIQSPELARHPTQLYEALFHLTAAVLLFWLGRWGVFKGQLIKLYILSYLGYRFLTELIRPEPEVWLNLTGYQWAALVLFPLFVWLWIRDSRQQKMAEGKSEQATELAGNT